MNCSECEYSEKVPGTDLTACQNTETHVKVNNAANRRGWVSFPFRFDSFWIEKCDNKTIMGTNRIDKKRETRVTSRRFS